MKDLHETTTGSTREPSPNCAIGAFVGAGFERYDRQLGKQEATRDPSAGSPVRSGRARLVEGPAPTHTVDMETESPYRDQRYFFTMKSLILAQDER